MRGLPVPRTAASEAERLALEVKDRELEVARALPDALRRQFHELGLGLLDVPEPAAAELAARLVGEGLVARRGKRLVATGAAEGGA